MPASWRLPIVELQGKFGERCRSYSIWRSTYRQEYSANTSSSGHAMNVSCAASLHASVMVGTGGMVTWHTRQHLQIADHSPEKASDSRLLCALQFVGEHLLSQALLPMVTAHSPNMRTSHRDGDGDAKVLQWSPDEATPAQDGSVEDALLTVLRFVAGVHAARHRNILGALFGIPIVPACSLSASFKAFIWRGL